MRYTVSTLCSELDARVRSFNGRRLERQDLLILLIDALFLRSREGDRAVMRAARSSRYPVGGLSGDPDMVPIVWAV